MMTGLPNRILLADRLASDEYPLRRVDEMRTRVKPCPIALLAQGRFKHGTDAALAVRTRYMDHWAAVLRVTESREELTNRLKPELDGLDFVA